MYRVRDRSAGADLAFALEIGRRQRGECRACLCAFVAVIFLLPFALPVFGAQAGPEVECEPISGLGPENVFLNCLDVYPRDRAALAVWETATEIDNAGFYVVRADTAAGTFVRVSPFVISLSDPTGQTGAHYEYQDTGLTNGRTYYYKLEAVNVSNQSQFVPDEPVSVTLPIPTATATATTAPPTATPTATPTAGPTLTPSNTPPPGASLTPTLTPSVTATAAPATASPTASPPPAGTATPTQIPPVTQPGATTTPIVVPTEAGPTATPEPGTPAKPPPETSGAPTSAPQPTDGSSPGGGPNPADLTPVVQNAGTAVAALAGTATPARTRVPPPAITPTSGQAPVNWALIAVAAAGAGLLLLTVVAIARRGRGPGSA